MKILKKTVILDADDVLYACNSTALKTVEKKTGKQLDFFRIDRWGILGDEDYDSRLELFSNPEFVRNLPLYKGAKEFVRELSKRYEVLICTSVPSGVYAARFNSLIENFPEIPAENIIFGSRKGFLSAWASLDDNPCNYKPGGNVKYPVIFTMPWYLKGNTGRLRTNSYEGFLQMLMALESVERYSEIGYNGIVVCGPSGAEKNKVCDVLCEAGHFIRVKSYSTREGKNYIKVGREAFNNNAEGFIEISSYMNEMYGLKASDIENVLLTGEKPLLLLDINGAIGLKKDYNFLTIFVAQSKEQCVRNILNKNISIEEKIERIVSLDTELLNMELCDDIYTNDTDISRIVNKIVL